jgi:hypothetical protein
MTMEMRGHCPICHEKYAESSEPTGRSTYYRCIRCGEFVLTRTAHPYLQAPPGSDLNSRTLLSYAVRKMQGKTEPILDVQTIKSILENTILPSLREQENNAILNIGANSNPGEDVGIPTSCLLAVVGCTNIKGLKFVINHLAEAKLLIHSKSPTGDSYLRLTREGWDRYEEIRRGNIDIKKAFMAMPFGKPELDEVYKHFKIAVAQTGFDLRRIDEQPKAGLIDDRLRIEIRTSRFLIAELTEENRGAYWEAGFAEGLGRPVIYTCEKKYFKQMKTHFDTNHHLTVLWEADKIDKAVGELKAVIRVTLPDEAILQDS